MITSLVDLGDVTSGYNSIVRTRRLARLLTLPFAVLKFHRLINVTKLSEREKQLEGCCLYITCTLITLYLYKTQSGLPVY